MDKKKEKKKKKKKQPPGVIWVKDRETRRDWVKSPRRGQPSSFVQLGKRYEEKERSISKSDEQESSVRLKSLVPSWSVWEKKVQIYRITSVEKMVFNNEQSKYKYNT